MDRTFGGTSGQGGKDVDGEIPPVIIAVMGPSGVSYLAFELVSRVETDEVSMCRLGRRRWSDLSFVDIPRIRWPTSKDPSPSFLVRSHDYIALSIPFADHSTSQVKIVD